MIMEKTNIAELLKGCPNGMELDCAMYDNVQFDIVQDGNAFPIKINTPEGRISLSKYGCYSLNPQCKCVITPKGKTTWEGFVPPCKFKDGDVVVNASNEDSNAFIYAGENEGYYSSYVGLTTGPIPFLLTDKRLTWVNIQSGIRLATEEEKEKLFQAIKENGYKWNPETKTLETLIKPKFKVGDRIAEKNGITKPFTISQVGDGYYYSHDQNAVGIMRIEDQDEYELVPNKFDITTLKPFESRVLVRDSDTGVWFPDFFGGLCDGDEPYRVIGGIRWKCCIPYEGNEHLLGKTDDCTEYYKTWE